MPARAKGSRHPPGVQNGNIKTALYRRPPGPERSKARLNTGFYRVYTARQQHYYCDRTHINHGLLCTITFVCNTQSSPLGSMRGFDFADRLVQTFHHLRGLADKLTLSLTFPDDMSNRTVGLVDGVERLIECAAEADLDSHTLSFMQKRRVCLSCRAQWLTRLTHSPFLVISMTMREWV